MYNLKKDDIVEVLNLYPIQIMRLGKEYATHVIGMKFRVDHILITEKDSLVCIIFLYPIDDLFSIDNLVKKIYFKFDQLTIYKNAE
jgi:hypothetical protein